MDTFLDILTIIGALGLFIFGMKVLSDGVQRAAGSSMRNVLEAMTSSQGRAISTGFITTTVLQTSSATTVMVVSFVNAGLLQLREAFGVIMGANIGTTLTAWLVALTLGKLQLSELALPIIALAVPFLFFKKQRIRHSAEAFIGFAVLLIGLVLLKESVPNLKESPETLEFLQTYLHMGFLSSVLFVLVGFVVTVILQSSSAAIALTLTLFSTGIIPLELAAAMVLGENIGTTITANIAAVVGNAEAKTAARSHLVFNLIGVVWMLPLLALMLKGLTVVSESILDNLQLTAGENRDRVTLALFHTSFNVLNTLLLVGFTPSVLKLSRKLVRTPKAGSKVKLEYIGGGVVGTPEVAMLEAQKEVARFARITAGMNKLLLKLLNSTDPVERAEIVEELRHAEEATDRLEVEVANYLTDLSKEEMSDEVSHRVRGMLGATNDLERIGDLYFQIAMNLESKQHKRVYFIPKQRQNLKEMIQLLEDAFAIMQSNIRTLGEKLQLEEAQDKEEEVNAMRNQLRRRHLKDIGKGRYSIESGMFYMDTFTALEEIADHIMSITEGLEEQE
jgi:phosphate:Na+ symporter